MTLAQNLPQRLSGNNWMILLFGVVLFIASCGPLKPIVDDGKDGDTDGDPDVIVVDTNGNNNTDPNDNNTNDPNNNNTNDPNNNNNNSSKGDPPISRPKNPRMIDWKDGTISDPTDPTDPEDPIVIRGGDDTTTTDPIDPSIDTVLNPTDPIVDGVLKSSYDVASVMPFYTDKVAESGGKLPTPAVRGLNFYEGALLALQQLSAEGVNLNVNVYDSKRSTAVVQGLVDNASLSNTDLVIGPASSNNLRLVADNIAKQGTPVVSLNLNPNIAESNPYYIQASPYYASHAMAVVKHIKANYPSGNVVLMAPNEQSDINRYQYFHNANALAEGSLSAPRFKEYTIQSSGDRKVFKFSDIQNYLSAGDTSVVIVTTSNQDYVNSLMRTLSLSRKRYPVVVFGMPRWMGFTRIDYSYYENLNLHISTSTFIDPDNSEAQTFKRSFYKEYGMPPTTEAFKGYDLMLYFGRLLNQYGTGFLNHLDQAPGSYLHSNFAFERVFSIPQNGGEGDFQIKQFENKYVNILRFKDYEFKKVNGGE